MKSSKVQRVHHRPPKPPQTPMKKKPKDPVEVYCRVRPLKEDELESCTERVSDTVLQLTPPECSLAFKSGHSNGSLHTFQQVFYDDCTQKDLFDRIGFPLVEGLLQSKNGLLFAYGITNSGKTYTMTGEPDNAGILPRSLDVIFNSIAEVQATRHVFRPDGCNGFNVFTEAEARSEANKHRGKKISAKARSEMPEFGDLLRVPEPRRVEGRAVDEDSSYAVYVSYVEIYNNYVYDLLEEVPVDLIKQKPPQSKNLREDQQHNMYISGATEVEVKSTEEAFETLYKGQKRRRVAHTQLNEESSRSHSVFTIRLVQAPLDPSGEEVLGDRDKVTFSQLSLVDLAGSERTSRTNSAGDRLREAGNINASLMVLRTCMETLRDNQINSASKIVPYRDSKLTHLFKNYFDGEGKVRMIVCVSPKAEDYVETIHVMRFAEVTQEVVVDRPSAVRKDVFGLAPGRRKANMLYKAAMKEAAVLREVESSSSSSGDAMGPAILANAPHPFKLALGVLCLQKYISEECDSFTLAEFRSLLESRAQVREQLIQELTKKQNTFRAQLVSQEEELFRLRSLVRDYDSRKTTWERSNKEVHRLKAIISSQDEQISHINAELEGMRSSLSSRQRELECTSVRLAQASQQKDMLMKTTELYEHEKRDLEERLVVWRRENEKQKEEKDQLRKRMRGYVHLEKERFEKLSAQMERKEHDLVAKSEKLRQVKELIRNSPCASVSRTPLRDHNTDATAAASTPGGGGGGGGGASGGGGRASDQHREPHKQRSPSAPIKGKGARKRSFSENWLQHKPTNTVDSGDLLQPLMKKKKTVTTPKPKDLRSKQVDKYCLQHQEEDSDGDLKTRLYKGEIMHTVGGGTSVQFTDVEVLHHSKPSQKPKHQSQSSQPPQSHQQSGPGATYSKGGAGGGGGGVVRRTTACSTNMQCSDDVSTCSETSTTSLQQDNDETETEEEWTDVETRCAVAIEGRPGLVPAVTHQRIVRHQ